MRRIGGRDIVAAVLIALVAGAIFTSPPLQVLQGLSLDILTALRGRIIGDRRDPATSPVVVVAIDNETYETPPFQGSPTQTWTREIGRVLNSITEGGAKVIGFDVIFRTRSSSRRFPLATPPSAAA
ncbi:CHASE2 domain-containing sensor protein [Bradyrhizobium centrosematis]|nr:CHASE2 domain-containing sensor protein [Bradyrhizobium centrosematis]MCS3777706.1 CHASE2 domain-containing sensor protein [Bradyrhizobium centrosematis]